MLVVQNNWQLDLNGSNSTLLAEFNQALTEHLYQSGVPSQSVLETNSAAATA